MSLSLTNVNGKLSLGYITGDGILATTNGELDKREGGLSASDLSSELQEKITSIDTMQGDMETIEETLANLSTGITLDTIVPVISDMVDTPLPFFAQQWSEAVDAGTANIIDIACSGDGKYIFVCPWSAGSAQFSSDYGVTWGTPSGVSANIWSCAMNRDGQYIVLADNNNYKISSDYGASFTNPSVRPASLQQAALSATGKYIVCACGSSQGLQMSSDYGATWTQRETGVALWKHAAITLDGTTAFACSDTGIISKTVNYGNSWETVYTAAGSASIKTLCCSADGKYVMATLAGSSPILLSTNYGVSFSSVGDTATYYTTAMSKNGMYMMASVNGSSLQYSKNYGTSWTTISNNRFTAVAMSYAGDSLYNVNPYAKVIFSRNDGTVVTTVQPVIATTGSMYFHAATNTLSIYNGTAWKTVGLE